MFISLSHLFQKNTYLLAGLAFFVCVAAALSVWFFARGLTSRESAVVSSENIVLENTEGVCPFRRALDGVCVSSQEDAYPLLVAVMIENHWDARPLSGIHEASVVYEAPVEANFSRFLAIFPANAESEKVGPVRSARPYYVDWLREYGTPLYMHVGGSQDALDRIEAWGVHDLNEFYRGWYYWRDDGRFAPHNVYTSSKLWNTAFADYDAFAATSTFDGWSFGAMSPCDELTDSLASCADVFTTTFNGSVYEAIWRYATSTNQYERYQVEGKQTDEGGNPILADTVVVQFVTTTVLDAIGRLGMETVGEGRAVVFRDGRMIEGVWKKQSASDRTEWRDTNGDVIPLNPGKIWIEVLNQHGSLSFGKNEE